MHRHFDDRFDAIDLGVRTVTYAHQIPSRPSPTPTTTIHTRKVTIDKVDKSVPVTPTDQVKEVIKDGKVSTTEKSALDKNQAATGAVVLSEQKRLTTAVTKATGDDVARDKAGRVELNDGKVVANAASLLKPTEHEARVTALVDSKATSNLDELDAQIAKLESSDSPVGLDALKAERSSRVADESKVVRVIGDKLSLVGTLEATKLDLAQGVSADSKDDYQKLRTDAQGWIDQLNDNGGQVYGGNDLFGDDWDESKTDFDQLAKTFNEDPDRLKDFVGSQGKNDDDLRGKSLDEVETYLGEFDDPKDAVQIALRYQAADELTGIFERYNSAKDTVESDTGAIAKIDAEIGMINGTVERDMQALSSESIERLERTISPIDGILEPATGSTVEAEQAEKAKAENTTNGTDGTPTTEPKTVPKTRDVTIDYSASELSTKVLAQAQKQNLLPEANVEFNKDGQAVYTVQQGDSYWRIADQSDGKPADQFDSAHFQRIVESNGQRLRGNPSDGMIHPSEQVVIDGRSLADLVKLLELPTTEQVAVRPVNGERVPY